MASLKFLCLWIVQSWRKKSLDKGIDKLCKIKRKLMHQESVTLDLLKRYRESCGEDLEDWSDTE